MSLDIPPPLRTALESFRATLAAKQHAARYRHDPVAYAREVHGVWLWGKQAEIVRALLEPPHRVMVKSANSIGKTLTAGVIAAWFFDCFDPGICIITGPRFDQIKDTTFKEIRRLKSGHPGLYPKLPRLEAAVDHYINGTTAVSGDAFQGIHCDSLMLLFEECSGVDPIFWEAARGIMAGGENCHWLAILNPTDPTAHAYVEEQATDYAGKPRWAVLSVSAFEHPNVAAELAGLPAPIPAAVRLGQLREHMDDWGDAMKAWPGAGELEATDVDLYDRATYGVEPGATAVPVVLNGRDVAVPVAEFLAGARRFWPSRWWRPGPVGESRILGRYPKLSAYSLFSEAYFDLAERVEIEGEGASGSDDPGAGAGADAPLQVGCDVARFGDDFTTIHVRRGRTSLHHIAYHGRDTSHTAGELKRVADEFGARFGVDPRRIPILVDDTGVGGGVVDQRGRYDFVPVNAGQSARQEAKYPNARSEMLFTLAESMGAGRISLKRLPPDARQALRRQGIGITYRLDSDGRRVAEPTEQMKKRLGRSPDDLVALALAYYYPSDGHLRTPITVPAGPPGIPAPGRADAARDWDRRGEARDATAEPPAAPAPAGPPLFPKRKFYGR